MTPRAIVVGTGFGCRIHVPALRAAGFEVAGLVGTDRERTERRAATCGVNRTFTDLGEAIAATGATAVTIATPPNTHAGLTLEALRRGCHVLCEKPLATDAGEARAILEAAEQAGVVHLVGNEFRWLPERAIVGRAIADGSIGEPRFLTVNQYLPLVADPAARMPRWWFDPASGGGWLGASGSHLIDMVRDWLGDFASLSATLPTVAAREGGAEDSFVVRFRMTNGVEGVIQQTAGAWGPPAAMTRIAGTQGTLWIEAGVVRVADRDGVRELPVPDDLTLPPIAGIDDPRQRMMLFELAPYIRLCEALRGAIKGMTEASAVAVPTFHDGLAAMVIIDAIRTSAELNGGLVVIPDHSD